MLYRNNSERDSGVRSALQMETMLIKFLSLIGCRVPEGVLATHWLNIAKRQDSYDW